MAPRVRAGWQGARLAAPAFTVRCTAGDNLAVHVAATKDQPGAAGQPVQVGDVTVASGDWVVGDADGVTVIAGDHVDAVVAAGQARAQRERELFDALRAGKTTVELLGLDPSPIDQKP